jgi:hypothetical protein
MHYLDNICEASAILCKRLEDKTVHEEFKARCAQKGYAHIYQPPVELADTVHEVLARQENVVSPSE